MEVVGEAILSAVLEPLIGKLTFGELLRFARKEQVDNEVKTWKSKLLKIHAVLSDAEEKQITSPDVKSWLSELRDLAYDVEDILDEIETEALGSKSREESQTGTSTIRKLLPTCCTALKPTAFISNMRAGSKLEVITTRLQKIDRQKDELRLATNAGGRSKRVNRRVTTSLVEPSVYGREKDKEAILELMSGESSDCQFSVIPIIGIGGVGKTTLAQEVYNDKSVKFDCKAWVSVSDDFDKCKITKTILLHWGSCEVNDLNVLQERLKEKLSGKKFLIVLDDVWSENYDDWTTLRRPFFAGAPGSKIIVTTRSERVSSTMGTATSYQLKALATGDCLSLFTRHALDAENFDAHPDLKEIGEEIVQKCKGLPLAAKTLGGLLRGKSNRKEWEDIMNSKMWNLPREKSSILPALELSYYYLPSNLKQCFAYCAIFPKDYEFNKWELVLLWMAEGFLQQCKGNKQMEELGFEYFDDLLSRSFFQQSSSDKSRYVMHDLISDLAQFVSGEICFNLTDDFKDVKSFEKIRHSSFTRAHHDISQKFEVFHSMKSLRTFLALPSLLPSWTDSYLSSKVLNDLVPKLARLRALSVAGYHSLEELPSSIGALKHLRYLNVSHTGIKRLPESVGKLLNLQTLILFGCQYLIELPACIGNLINLRHLDINGTDSLQEMPPQIGNLRNLHTLSKFIVGQRSGHGIRELMKLSHLQGTLRIKGLQNVGNIRDEDFTNLKEKKGLNELTLEWIDDFHGLRSEIAELQVLDALQPHQSVEKLSVISYGGTKFPSWVGDPSFTKMVLLQLHNCRKSTSLPPLGHLPLLRDLSIKGMDGVKEVGVDFYGNGSFQSLKTLLIEDMLEWKQWSWSNGPNEEALKGFPKLLKLGIRRCPKLVGKLPSYLPSLKELNIYKCPLLAELPELLPSLCKLNVEECQEMVLKSVPDLVSLTTLRIKRISGLVFLHDGLIQALVALEDLEIESCNELTYLWQDGSNIDKLASLKRLVIHYCKQLVSFLVEGEEELLPCSLEELSVMECDNLEKLPNGLHSLTSLRDLRIYRCPKLVSFPEGRGGLPYSLKHLEIVRCDSLKWLPDGMMIRTIGNNSNLQCLLEELVICSCPSLESFPSGKLPTTLKSLSIREHGSLPPPEGIWSHSLEHLYFESCKIQSLFLLLKQPTTLKSLSIMECDDLEGFPERGLPFPNLRDLQISECKNLRCLPNHMDNLTSLQHLYIWNCSGLVSFPEGGFPPNLIDLDIRYCKNLTQPMSEWQLHKLTSLKVFTIEGSSPSADMMVSFPDDDALLLPTSLSLLLIQDFVNLESISTSLQNLTSLEFLCMWKCPKLRFLPKEGLPATLGCLEIGDCPLLKERCIKDRGDFWPIIAHIPCVEIYDD